MFKYPVHHGVNNELDMVSQIARANDAIALNRQMPRGYFNGFSRSNPPISPVNGFSMMGPPLIVQSEVVGPHFGQGYRSGILKRPRRGPANSFSRVNTEDNFVQPKNSMKCEPAIDSVTYERYRKLEGVEQAKYILNRDARDLKSKIVKDASKFYPNVSWKMKSKMEEQALESIGLLGEEPRPVKSVRVFYDPNFPGGFYSRERKHLSVDLKDGSDINYYQPFTLKPYDSQALYRMPASQKKSKKNAMRGILIKSRDEPVSFSKDSFNFQEKKSNHREEVTPIEMNQRKSNLKEPHYAREFRPFTQTLQRRGSHQIIKADPIDVDAN